MNSTTECLFNVPALTRAQLADKYNFTSQDLLSLRFSSTDAVEPEAYQNWLSGVASNCAQFIFQDTKASQPAEPDHGDVTAIAALAGRPLEPLDSSVESIFILSSHPRHASNNL